MITRRELFEEVKKNPRASPGGLQFGIESLKILYALHRSYFESQSLFLDEDSFNANQVVIKAVKNFNGQCRRKWKKSNFIKKDMFRNYEKWLSVTLDFTAEKDNFFQPLMVQEPPTKPIACQPKPLSALSKEAERICENVSSDEVLILDRMITRRELFEEVKKNPKAYPGKTQFRLEALKILYALHSSYFESQGLFLDEGSFNANQVVINAVGTFNRGCGEKWKKCNYVKKEMFRKYEDWFSMTLDFTEAFGT